MARKTIDDEMKKLIKETWDELGTYAATARALGISSSTAKKYVDLALKPKVYKITDNPIRFEQKDLPPFSNQIFKGVEDFGSLCSLSKEEREEIEILWEELEF